MSIKSKRPINESTNQYRWRQVEEYLISAGYVLQDPNASYKIWVDCVGNGRNIAFRPSSLRDGGRTNMSEMWRKPDPLSFSSLPEGVYDVLMRDGYAGHRIYKQCTWISAAVHYSRENPRYLV